jgi:hypothetical protein
MMRRVVALVLLAVALTGTAARSAHAHGDPASEYLVGHQVYLPFDLKAPAAKERRLVALVAEANRTGFTLRVALVWSRYDLGPLNAVWRKPLNYARYLTADMKADYTNRVLVVMPNGFGFSRLGHSATAEESVLSKLGVERGPGGFVDSSAAAVRALAAASGVTLSGVTPAKPSTRNRDRVAIVAAALALAAVLRVALRRRR